MKKLSSLSRKQFALLLFVFAFAVEAFFVWCSPMYSDDYYFGSLPLKTFADYTDFLLHYDDGRLLGNLFNVVFLRSTGVRMVENALITALIVVLLPKALGVKSKLSYLLSFLLVFGLSPKIFCQIFSWNSGFQHYGPPLLLTLFSFLLWQGEHGEKPALFALRAVGIFLLTLVGQLFMEHNAIITALAAGTAFVLSLRDTPRKRTLSLVWLLAALLGAAPLFLKTHFFESTYGHNIGMYRGVHLSSLSDCFATVWSNLQYGFDYLADCVTLCVFAGVLVLVVLQKTKARWRHSGWHSAASVSALLMAVYPLIRRLFFAANRNPLLWTVQQLVFAAVCLAFLVSFIACAAHMADRRRFRFLCILTGLSVLALGAVMVISPLAERCMFLTAFLLGAALLVLFDALCAKLSEKTQQRLMAVLVSAVIVLGLCLCAEYGGIRRVADETQDYIEECMAAGDTDIKLPRIPSEYVFNDTSTWLGKWYYYAEQNDISFNFTDYLSWSAFRQIPRVSPKN